MRGDDLSELLRFLHGLAHHVLILHAAAVVGKARHKGRHAFHVGKLEALLAHGDGPVGQHVHHGVATDDLKLPFQMSGRIRHGVQIGHGAHRGVSAVRGRKRTRADGLLARKTRLTKMHMDIYEAGNNATPAHIGFRHPLHGRYLRRYAFYSAVPNKDVALRKTGGPVHHGMSQDAIHENSLKKARPEGRA